MFLRICHRVIIVGGMFSIVHCANKPRESPRIFLGADGLSNLTGIVYECDLHLAQCEAIDNQELGLAQNDVYAVSAVHTGQNLFVGAYFRSKYALRSGSLFRCNASGRECVELSLTYLSLMPQDRFARSLHFFGGYLYVGAIGRNGVGAVFQCNAQGENCSQLMFGGLTLNTEAKFGAALAGHGAHLFVSAITLYRDGKQFGALFRCSLDTANCIEFPLVIPTEDDRFGEDIVISGKQIFVGSVGRGSFRGSLIKCDIPRLACVEYFGPPGYSILPDEAFGGRVFVHSNTLYVSAYKRNNILGSVFVCDLSLTACTEKSMPGATSPFYFGSALAAAP